MKTKFDYFTVNHLSDVRSALYHLALDLLSVDRVFLKHLLGFSSAILS